MTKPKKDGLIDIQKSVDEIKKQIDYDYLINYAERDIVDEVVNIMAEVMTIPRPKYKIEGDFVEYDAVLNNLKKITAEQLEVCLLAYSRQRQRIRNPKAYWISVLYNIPLTSNIVLQNMVNSDMYETGGLKAMELKRDYEKMFTQFQEIEKEKQASIPTISFDNNKVVQLSVDSLNPFHNHPFELYTGERFENLTDSIKACGVITPLLIRKLDDNTYQILSGHNRNQAAKAIGLKTVPCIVLADLTDDDAIDDND